MKIMTLAGILLLSAAAHAEPRRGMGGAYGARFDPKTVEEVKGEVVEVRRVSAMRGVENGVHLMVKTDKETIEVHLGPSWYLEKNDGIPAKGEKVEARGSRVEFEGKPALIAIELKDGDRTLKLRDEAGVPLWSGRRRR